MPIKKDTKKQVKMKLEGMMCHCMDLTEFLGDHINDPYFETEQGKRIRKLIMSICANHAMALMEFMMERTKGDEDGDNKSIDIEQMLKDIL